MLSHKMEPVYILGRSVSGLHLSLLLNKLGLRTPILVGPRLEPKMEIVSLRRPVAEQIFRLTGWTGPEKWADHPRSADLNFYNSGFWINLRHSDIFDMLESAVAEKNIKRGELEDGYGNGLVVDTRFYEGKDNLTGINKKWRKVGQTWSVSTIYLREGAEIIPKLAQTKLAEKTKFVEKTNWQVLRTKEGALQLSILATEEIAKVKIGQILTDLPLRDETIRKMLDLPIRSEKTSILVAEDLYFGFSTKHHYNVSEALASGISMGPHDLNFGIVSVTEFVKNLIEKPSKDRYYLNQYRNVAKYLFEKSF